MKNITRSLKIHNLSSDHIASSYQFINLKNNNNLRNESFKIEVCENHAAKKAKEYYDAFCILIDAALYLINQGLSFRGSNETGASSNKGNFLELTNLLKKSYNNEGLFKDFSISSSAFQNKLIASIYNVSYDAMKKELEKAKFFSIIVDEATDVKNSAQLSISIRYFYRFEAIERFIGFVNLKEKRSADDIASEIFKIGEVFNFKEKLAFQIYDGAPVMAGKYTGVQQKLSEKFGGIPFIQCTAHILNLALRKYFSRDSYFSSFLVTVQNIGSFFSKSSKMKALLNKACGREMPSTIITRWNYNSRILNFLRSNSNEIITVFNQIKNNPRKYKNSDIRKADEFSLFLKDDYTMFQLNFLSDFYNDVEIIFSLLQKTNTFPSEFFELYKDFCEKFKNSRFIFIEKKTYNMCKIEDFLNSFAAGLDIEMSANATFDWLFLLDPKKFPDYRQNFPANAFINLVGKYKFFDRSLLKSQLKFLYSYETFKKLSNSELLKKINNEVYSNIFSEVITLGHLLTAYGLTTSSAERSFSYLKLIHTKTRNRQSQARLNHLSFLYIEKKMVKAILSKDNAYKAFYEEFIR